jgi:hypothetical protein
MVTTHSEIVRRAGKAEAVALACGVSVHTVRSWIRRDSVPPDQWLNFSRLHYASLEDLAAAAAGEPVDPDPQSAAA